MRLAQIEVHSRIDWDQQWRMRSKTAPLPASFPNRCTVSVLNLDITKSKIAPLVDQQMRQLARTVDRSVPGMTSIRPTAQQIWTALQMPFEIAPRTYLVIDPLEIALSAPSGSGLAATSALALRAETRVVVGERPAPPTKALPALRAWPGDATGLRIPVRVDLSWADATTLLSREIAGRQYRSGSTTLRIDAIRLTPGDSGRVVMNATVDYRSGLLSRYRGPVLFQGIPVVDPATRTIFVRDLDYVIDRKHANVFLRVADRVAHDTLRDQIRQNARWSIAPRMAEIESEIARAMMRPLTSGVSLRGNVTAVTPRAVSPSPGGLAIDLLVTGSADIVVSQWK
jgi:hypothetical protein